MRLKGLKVGFVITGSYCTIRKVIDEIKKIVDEGAKVFPIVSHSVSTVDTRFGKASELCEEISKITGNNVMKTIVESEPIGPKKLLDVLVVAPCTGNTLAKLANGITDSSALMAVKAHLRNQRPVIIGVSTNDGLGINARNIATLLNTKNIYFVPFGQDDPIAKPNSLIAHFDKIIDTICYALYGKQIQPVLVEYKFKL